MIKPFKERTIDYSKTVRVYRNLTSKNYSIKQNGKVVGHATHLALVSCTFEIIKSGQRRVRETKEKNVHAFICGFISTKGTMGTAPEWERPLPAKITYNPYKDDSFMCNVSACEPHKITSAMGVIINSHGVTAAYTN